MNNEFDGLLELKTEFEGIVYRNIATIYHSQNLFDDLNDCDEEGILQKYENATSGISHDSPQKNRVFEYAQPHPSCISGVFNPPFRYGRYGDGNGYGVWYAALDEKTSIYEALFHQWYQAQKLFQLNKGLRIISVERKMYACNLRSQYVLDFREKLELYDKLTSDNYMFCNELGSKVKSMGAEMLLVPSARNLGGVCSPVFLPEIIKNEKAIYYLKFNFHKNGKSEIERISNEKEVFEIPVHWEKYLKEKPTVN